MPDWIVLLKRMFHRIEPHQLKELSVSEVMGRLMIDDLRSLQHTASVFDFTVVEAQIGEAIKMLEWEIQFQKEFPHDGNGHGG